MAVEHTIGQNKKKTQKINNTFTSTLEVVATESRRLNGQRDNVQCIHFDVILSLVYAGRIKASQPLE